MSGFKAVSKAAARRQIVEDPRIEKIANALLVLHTQQEYVDEISTLWQSAQEKFLTIGRYLIQARDTLHTLPQHLVHDSKRIHQARLAVLRPAQER